MLLIKDIKTRLRERRKRIEKDYLISEFIFKMREYDINLSRGECDTLISNDLMLPKIERQFGFNIKDDLLIINYNDNFNLVAKVFHNYLNITNTERHFLYIDKVNINISLINIYKNIIKNFNITNNDFCKLFRVDDERKSMTGYSSFQSYYSDNEHILKKDIYKTFLYPRICFRNNILEKEIVLDCYVHDSPFSDLSDYYRNILFNIIEKDLSYEIYIYDSNFFKKIASCEISREIDFEEFMAKLINIIRSVGLTSKAKDLLDIEDWRDFNEERSEALKMLSY